MRETYCNILLAWLCQLCNEVFIKTKRNSPETRVIQGTKRKSDAVCLKATTESTSSKSEQISEAKAFSVWQWGQLHCYISIDIVRVIQVKTLRGTLGTQPRLWSWSSCLKIWSTEVSGMDHHAWLQTKTSKSGFSTEKLERNIYIYSRWKQQSEWMTYTWKHITNRETHNRDLHKLGTGLNPDSQIALSLRTSVTSFVFPYHRSSANSYF